MKRAHLLAFVAVLAACDRGRTVVVPEPRAAEPAVVEPARPPAMRDAPPAGTRILDTSHGWWVEPTEDGRMRLSHDGALLGELTYHFWGKDWTWEPAPTTVRMLDGSSPVFRMEVAGMSLTIDGRIDATGPGEIAIHWTLKASRDLKDIIGGAVMIQLMPDQAVATGITVVPDLAADLTGFSWNVPEGKLSVRFDPPLAHQYWEPNTLGQYRGLWFAETLTAGTYESTMTVTLPDGGRVEPPLSIRWGQPEFRAWHPATLDWDRWPVDVSHVGDGAPVGSHGVLKADGDRLVFEDGTPARLWGTNVVGYAIVLGDRDAMCRQAERIAALGFNLVRITHLDQPWLDPNLFERGRDTRTLSASTLDNLDWWIKCLQDRGVYVWLDLHMGRAFRPGDGVPAYDEVVVHNSGQVEGLSYVNPRVGELMAEFARQFLAHENRYTGKRYAEDPGIVGLLVVNENNLTHHFGNYMNRGAGHPQHREMLKRAATTFVRRHGFDLEDATEAWRPGPSKIVMNELEHRFFVDAIDNVRKAGYRGPIATTNYWGDERLSSLPSLTAGDVVDVHAYGGDLQLEVNPHHDATFLHFLASGQVEGRPMTITEWNLPPPVQDRYTGPAWVAPIAALQGWDAVMHYCYNVHPTEDPWEPSQWAGWVDPAQMALMPAAAVAFREGHVAPAKTTYRIAFDRESLYVREASPWKMAALRTLTEQSRVVIALPDIPELDWDRAAPATPGAVTVTELDRDFLPAQGTVVRSDTGELARDWGRGLLTLDTAGSQWAVGWLDGVPVALSDVTVDVSTPHAAVTVTSLDGEPIRRSRRLLVTTVARVTTPDGRFPVYAEPVIGTVRIASDLDVPLTITPLVGGSRSAQRFVLPEPGRRDGDGWVFRLPAEVPTHWFVVRPAAGP